MKISSRRIIVGAALAGLLNGAVVRQTLGESTNAVAGTVAAGQKAPKIHGCAGMNDCKGLGGCESGDNHCKFKNSCKGKGGCEITQKDIKTWQQKQQDAIKPQN